MITKFDLKDIVWIKYKHKPISGTIKRIYICEKFITYGISVKNNSHFVEVDIPENFIFKTKRELLNSFLTEEDKL